MVEFGKQATNCGITTCTDLGGLSLLSDKFLAPWQSVTRVSTIRFVLPSTTSAQFLAAKQTVRQQPNALWTFAKTSMKSFDSQGEIHFDGSIQGFSALLNPPGYFQGSDHGQLLVVPEQLQSMLQPFHARGINIHMHATAMRLKT